MGRERKYMRVDNPARVERVFLLVADVEGGPGITAYQQTLVKPRMSIAAAKQLRSDLDKAIYFLENT